MADDASARPFQDRVWGNSDFRRLGRRLVCEVLPEPHGLPASALNMLHEIAGRAWVMGAQVAIQKAAGVRACRLCGCTDAEACNPPCSWVEPDLCSACW